MSDTNTPSSAWWFDQVSGDGIENPEVLAATIEHLDLTVKPVPGIQ